MDKPSYQITKHSIGSVIEMWTVSWPLILSLLSMSLMLFMDRLLLSRYATDVLNASASANTAGYALLILPLSIAAISEVFVGHYHGEGQNDKLGKPIWQIVWFSLLLTPVYILIGSFLPYLIFFGSDNFELESTYFGIYVYFAGIFSANIAITGFFVGTGRLKTVTMIAVFANICNILLDYILIYGWGVIPEMGIRGAALATGLCETIQVLILGSMFLKKRYRQKYGTASFGLNFHVFKESVRIGLPSGIALTFEVFTQFLFFRMMQIAGGRYVTVAALAQSFYYLFYFFHEGLSKGVSTVCSNILGGKKEQYISRVLRSAVILHTFFCLCVALLLFFFSKEIIDAFFSEGDEVWLADEKFMGDVRWSFVCLTFFLFFDGLYRVFTGFFTVAGDTKFLLWTSVSLNIFAFSIPTFLIVTFAKESASYAWLVMVGYGMMNCIVSFWRYRSKRWVASSQKINQPIIILPSLDAPSSPASASIGTST